jgi:hypothetical protein
MEINVTYGSNLSTFSATVQAEFKAAVNTAVQFYDNLISNPITVTINFDYGKIDGQAMLAGAGGESISNYGTTDYGSLYTAVQSTDTTSTVQTDAAALLPATDPTGGKGTFNVNYAEAQALGLLPADYTANTGSNPVAGYVGLSSGLTFDWSQTGASNKYDPVGMLEHEISEVLGRADQLGVNNQYTLLDFFHYTAKDGKSGDAPGSAAGALDEPFVAHYSASAYSYFSYDGQKVTLQYDTPAQVTAGDDVADWASNSYTVHNATNNIITDAYNGSAQVGAAAVSATDIQELNVLGYDLATPCYCEGTLILTLHGEVAVEKLKRGDLAMTTEGVAKPISWIGRRAIRAAFADPLRNWPVRVMAGALGENVPSRDLLLSPDHALLVEGVLIQAGALVNGTSILRETQVPERFTYYHVELDDHSLILAENAPAETFVDNIDRSGFDNWAEHEALYPDGKPMIEMPYPRAKGRRQVPMHIRAALEKRAKIIGAAEVLAVA